jgi:hypothetical protein
VLKANDASCLARALKVPARHDISKSGLVSSSNLVWSISVPRGAHEHRVGGID